MSSLTIIRHLQRGFLLESTYTAPRPLEEVFAFFSDAANLQLLTPQWIRFRVLTPLPIEMRVGALIDYRLQIRGLSVRWQSEITAWEPKVRFVDEQRRGPYSWWRHEHQFEAREDGTHVIDRVHYGVPGGALVNWLIVGRSVERIFAYRRQALERLFPATAAVSLSAATSRIRAGSPPLVAANAC